MDIYTLQELPDILLQSFLDDAKGKNAFSQLASSQTGNDRTVSRERITYMKNSPEQLMLVAVDRETLIGMAAAQRVIGINNVYMYIHDVVVRSDIRGKGIGSKIVTELMKRGEKKWPEIVRIQLTSRPSRGAGPFFQKLGFRPRTKETGDETIVYVKDIGSYTS